VQGLIHLKSRLLLSWTCCALLTLSAAQAADKKAVADDNLIGLKTANGKLVYKFINMWWNEKKSEIKIAANSTTRFEIRQLISQGGLVFAHVQAVKPNGPGSELVR
jgi:hypothetical protein